jgi:hypothetical protein
MLTRNDIPMLEGDLTNQILVLRPDMLGKRWQLSKFQLVRALGGFGCSPTAIGSSVYTVSLVGEERCNYRRGDFLGIASQEQIDVALAEKGGELPLDPTDMCFLAIGKGYWGRAETLALAKKNCQGKAMIAFHCHIETQVNEMGYLTWPFGCPEPIEVWKKHTT